MTGPYRFDLPEQVGDCGHVVDVEAVREPGGAVARIHPQNENVDARLRQTMKTRSRMWSIDSMGHAVEALINAVQAGKSVSSPQPEAEKAKAFSEALRQAAWTDLEGRYQAAELERLVQVLLERVFREGRVEHRGGPSERGADLVVYTRDPLGFEYRVVVQVKRFDGELSDTHALVQIEQAVAVYRAHAGLVVTTAETVSESFETMRAEVEEKLGVGVQVMDRDFLVGLLLEHVGSKLDADG